MRFSSPFSVAAFVLCQTIVWTCPAYCSAMAAQSDQNDTRPSSGHEHHHSGHDTATAAHHQESSADTASLTGIHCGDCGVAAPALLMRTSESFSARSVADAELATPAESLLRVVGVLNFASSHPLDTSPPPGISPLRI
jgi:hypothetical protein